MIGAPYASRPDRQQRQLRAPILLAVSGKTVIGSGANRLELYPLRGETSERQMMVWVPGQGLLYGSDPFQRLPDGSFTYPQTVSELVDATRREGLRPQTFFMMHIPPTPWSDLQLVVSAASQKNTPDGARNGLPALLPTWTHHTAKQSENLYVAFVALVRSGGMSSCRSDGHCTPQRRLQRRARALIRGATRTMPSRLGAPSRRARRSRNSK